MINLLTRLLVSVIEKPWPTLLGRIRKGGPTHKFGDNNVEKLYYLLI
jgi:hypothetical protein